jgi:drug/metabolite transporter (DMT)-like permease
MVAIVLAVLAACANAGASVLQRKADTDTPPDAGALAVLLHQLRQKLWFAGIGLMVVAFLLQAVALHFGGVALVQPVLAGELPLTLVLGARVLHRRLRPRDWGAAVLMAAGLAGALAAAAPSGGRTDASGIAWALGCGTGAAVLAVLWVLGRRIDGSGGAALLGTTAGGLFGLTAVVMDTVSARVTEGAGTLFASWQLYAMCVGGAAAVIVLQQAYAKGTLAASQPGVTLVDPIVSVLLGVFLFAEQLRLGVLVVLEVACLAVVVAGAFVLSRSPLTDDVNR